MILRFRALVVVCVLLAGTTLAQTTNETVKELWFPVGEELVYRISWGVIPVGYSHVTSKYIEEGGRKLIAIRFRTITNRFLSKLYPVDDYLESIIDPETFLPIRFTKKLSEGTYRAHQITTFDFQNLTAHWTNALSSGDRFFPIEKDTRDLITYMFYMRRTQFETNTVYKFKVMADEKIYDLVVQSMKVEDVDLDDYGDVPSLKFYPEAAFGGLFVRKGKMWMWVSQDSRHIATKVSVSVPVASVSLTLAQVRGPGDDLWIRKAPKDLDIGF